MIVPERFRTAVRTHLVRLDRRDSLYRHLSAPRILCIQGPPGVGKSSQLGHCLRDVGSTFVRLDTSQLGGQFEGDPIRDLDEAIEGLRGDHRGGTRPTLVIDDLDMSLGVLSDRSYTVNTQLTSGWLMAQADRVYEPGFAAGEPAIVVTGNDFSGVHRPLLRSGRARLFDYSPTPEEVAAVLGPIFDVHVAGRAKAFVEEFPNAVVADFLEAISVLRDRWLEVSDLLDSDRETLEAPKVKAKDLRTALAALSGARS